MAPKAPAVCFHSLAKCGFCEFPRRAVMRPPPRCAACGRFVPRKHEMHVCSPCHRRGFKALHLFPIPRRRVA